MKTQMECWRALDEGKTLIGEGSRYKYFLVDGTLYQQSPYGGTGKSSVAFIYPSKYRVEAWWDSAPDKFWLVRGKYGDVTLIIPHNFTQDILEKITPLTKSEILSYAEHAPE